MFNNITYIAICSLYGQINDFFIVIVTKFKGKDFSTRTAFQNGGTLLDLMMNK